MNGGADSFLLKLYFSKIHRDETNEQRAKYKDDRGVATLAEVFDDLMAVLQETDTSEEGASSSGSVVDVLKLSRKAKLHLHAKQLLIGRVLPIVDQLLGDRIISLANELAWKEEVLSEYEGLDELLRIAKCLQDHEEEDFEDGIAWIKCLFICKLVSSFISADCNLPYVGLCCRIGALKEFNTINLHK